MDKFKELCSLCKASVQISVNDHKDYYESVTQHLAEHKRGEDIDKEVLDEMIKRDTVVEVIAYADSPGGFYDVYHYDIDMALDIVINVIKAQRKL